MRSPQLPNSTLGPRWNSRVKAIEFLTAAEADPSASPYDYEAIPPHVCEITDRGLISVQNPEWVTAKYEMIFTIDRPSGSKISETNQ